MNHNTSIKLKANGGDDVHLPPEPSDGDIPRSESSISLEVPNSVVLWTVDPRPPHSSEVTQLIIKFQIFIIFNKDSFSSFLESSTIILRLLLWL